MKQTPEEILEEFHKLLERPAHIAMWYDTPHHESLGIVENITFKEVHGKNTVTVIFSWLLKIERIRRDSPESPGKKKYYLHPIRGSLREKISVTLENATLKKNAVIWSIETPDKHSLEFPTNPLLNGIAGKIKEGYDRNT